MKESVLEYLMAMGVQGLSKVGKVFESLQAIGRLLGPARTTAKCERCLLTTSDAIIACPDLHSLACCTQVTFHMLAGQNSRISDSAPSRRFSFHETPVGRL